MQTAAPHDAKLTRQAALPQLGLRPTATEGDVEAAYTAAVAEIDLMSRNSRSEALSASYRRAREQIEKAYQFLKAARNQMPAVAGSSAKAEVQPPAEGSRASAMRQPTVEVSGEPAPEVVKPQPNAASAWEDADKAREEATRAQAETAQARRVVEELRAQSQALSEEVSRVRERLKTLGEEAQTLRQTVSQLGVQTNRELAAIADVRKRADGLLLSAQRNESEIATAAVHAEAYRDSAMYAAQAAERVLRALSAETTGT